VSRALLVCPEPLGHGQPAGIGIRFVEIARVLRADGHSVTILSPDSGLTPENLHDRSAVSDVAIVQGHVANDFFAHAKPIPTVVDLYDPFIVENLHYFASRGGEVFAHDHATLLQSLLRGDVFLCASEAQRLFYLGLLLAVGRLNPLVFEADAHADSLLRIAPFGVAPERPHVARDLDAPAILFGGIYDWYDPIVAIDAVALVRRELPKTTLTFTRHPNPEITPQGRLAEAMRYARELPWVRFEPWAPYEQRAEFFERFTLALLTFPQSIETDLSMRTRIYDYLWSGLPIVTSSAPGTDEIIERYGAGHVVASVPSVIPSGVEGSGRVGRDTDATRPDPSTSLGMTGGTLGMTGGGLATTGGTLATTVLNILRDRSHYTSLQRGTRDFARDHQWSRTLAPLREFVSAPRFDPAKEAFAVTFNVPVQRQTLLQRIRRRIGAAS
jgi:glycosyltransferase involved in cell wall biosynthesis